MPPNVVVLNGGSSAGKTSIARCLQDVLAPVWLTFGIDDLVHALPGGHLPPGSQRTLDFAPDGSIGVGDEFRQLETAWHRSMAAMVRTGARLILDEVLLGGGQGQRHLESALGGTEVLWVGVRCPADVAAAREAARPDRVVGMARSQADLVHRGMRYDMEVDTATASASECAAAIAARL